jgi:hypothetical protein
MARRDDRIDQGRPRTRGRHRTILVYCEGRSTERAYFDGLRNLYPDSAVSLDVKHKARHPADLVMVAVNSKLHNPASYDEVWCVVDVDDRDLGAAKDLAGKHGVLLTVSDPCFELWLLLHHTDCTSYVDGYADAVGRLRKHVPSYDKTRLNFGDFAGGVTAAVKRAKMLDPEGNPSTGMWRLVERVMEQE